MTVRQLERVDLRTGERLDRVVGNGESVVISARGWRWCCSNCGATGTALAQ